MLILGQKSCFLGPTIFKIPQPILISNYVHTKVSLLGVVSLCSDCTFILDSGRLEDIVVDLCYVTLFEDFPLYTANISVVDTTIFYRVSFIIVILSYSLQWMVGYSHW